MAVSVSDTGSHAGFSTTGARTRAQRPGSHANLTRISRGGQPGRCADAEADRQTPSLGGVSSTPAALLACARFLHRYTEIEAASADAARAVPARRGER